jgi:hypothetical protein
LSKRDGMRPLRVEHERRCKFFRRRLKLRGGFSAAELQAIERGNAERLLPPARLASGR